MAEHTFSDANFATEVEQESSMPVLVDFWAPWCGPCRIQGPIIEEIAKEFEGKVKVGKLEVDENPMSAQKYNVLSIPTVALYKNGQIVWQGVGVQSKEKLAEELQSALS
ncbi:MAG: thioredoxin [Candidatus Nomurabacteria bacterium]|nr:MAG: thioredoxin [Candidatus Nomurabacteria bacterium]